MIRRPPRSPLFPTPPLFRSVLSCRFLLRGWVGGGELRAGVAEETVDEREHVHFDEFAPRFRECLTDVLPGEQPPDDLHIHLAAKAPERRPLGTDDAPRTAVEEERDEACAGAGHLRRFAHAQRSEE